MDAPTICGGVQLIDISDKFIIIGEISLIIIHVSKDSGRNASSSLQKYYLMSLMVYYNKAYGLVSVKATSPVLAPPLQVDLKLPLGHVALAARMHPSQRPLDTLIVAPEAVGFKVNFAVPDTPVVLFGAPPHFWMDPAMPPQIASVATFMSWVSILLQYVFSSMAPYTYSVWVATYAFLSVHVVPVTAAGLTSFDARISRVLSFACGSMGLGTAAERPEKSNRAETTLVINILALTER